MRKFAVLLATVLMATVLALPSFAVSNRTRFSQWIAPLECTRSEVDNGVTTTIILTPDECDDLLHPKPPDEPDKPDTPDKPSRPHVPGSPDTGVYRDPIVDLMLWSCFAAVTAVVVVAARRRSTRRR